VNEPSHNLSMSRPPPTPTPLAREKLRESTNRH